MLIKFSKNLLEKNAIRFSAPELRVKKKRPAGPCLYPPNLYRSKLVALR